MSDLAWMMDDNLHVVSSRTLPHSVMACWPPAWLKICPRRLPLAFFEEGRVPRELEREISPAAWRAVARLFNQWYAHEGETNAMITAFSLVAAIATAALVLSGWWIPTHEVLVWGGVAFGIGSALVIAVATVARLTLAPRTCVPRRWDDMCEYLNERHLRHNARCRVRLVAHGVHGQSPSLVFRRVPSTKNTQ